MTIFSENLASLKAGLRRLSIFIAILVTTSSTAAVALADNAWLLKEVKYGREQYSTWEYDFLDSHIEHAVTLGEAELISEEKVTKSGKVTLDARFSFVYDTPTEALLPGRDISLRVAGSSSGNPYNNASESFMSYVDTWSMAGDKLTPLHSMSIYLDSGQPSANGSIAFQVPELFNGQLIIRVRLAISADCYVHFIYEPGTATPSHKGYVIENTGSGEVQVNDVVLPQNNSREVSEFDRVLLRKNAKAKMSADCLLGLAHIMDIIYPQALFDEWLDLRDFQALILSLEVLASDPSLCPYTYNSKTAWASTSNQITLSLKSGAGRFNVAQTGLAMDIGTSTSQVSSSGRNDFAVGFNPNTNLTVAACYDGRVTVDPVNPALPSVTLQTGEQVEVLPGSIGPVTKIPQNAFLPSIYLLLNGNN